MQREASIGLELQHPNIARVFDFVKEETELVLGWNLLMERHYWNFQQHYNRPFRWNEIEGLIQQLCQGLQYAHSKGVVHRDIKPENIMISKQGSLKILDFGIVKLSESDGLGTKTGIGLGTPWYASPEQMDNAKDVDKRADIYALWE